MTKIIAVHELRVMWRSPFAWIAAALLQIVFSWLFLSAIEQFSLLTPAAQNSRASGLSSYLIVQFLAPASIVMMLATPLLCMNLIAAERQSGRYALLASSPVSPRQIVIGKFIGALVFQLSIIAISIALISVLALFTPLDISHLLCAILGLTLFVTAATALSLFYSSMTQKPALAAFLSFTTLLLLWLAAASGGALAQLSPSAHLTSFMKGLLDTRDIVYFLSATGIMLSLCICKLDSLNSRSVSLPATGAA